MVCAALGREAHTLKSHSRWKLPGEILTVADPREGRINEFEDLCVDFFHWKGNNLWFSRQDKTLWFEKM